MAPNTVMDVDRYEQDLAALTAEPCGQRPESQRHRPLVRQRHTFTWTAGLERKFGNLTADASYVGTAAKGCRASVFPMPIPGASPGFAPHTQFDSAGNVIGGFGVENVIFGRLALHLSCSANVAFRDRRSRRTWRAGELYLE